MDNVGILTSLSLVHSLFLEREKNEKKWQEDWARMTKMEKIRMIREKELDNMKINVTMRPEKLQLPQENPPG